MCTKRGIGHTNPCHFPLATVGGSNSQVTPANGRAQKLGSARRFRLPGGTPTGAARGLRSRWLSRPRPRRGIGLNCRYPCRHRGLRSCSTGRLSRAFLPAAVPWRITGNPAGASPRPARQLPVPPYQPGMTSSGPMKPGRLKKPKTSSDLIKRVG
jgi:hypothetical protein